MRIETIYLNELLVLSFFYVLITVKCTTLFPMISVARDFQGSDFTAKTCKEQEYKHLNFQKGFPGRKGKEMKGGSEKYEEPIKTILLSNSVRCSGIYQDPRSLFILYLFLYRSGIGMNRIFFSNRPSKAIWTC